MLRSKFTLIEKDSLLNYEWEYSVSHAGGNNYALTTKGADAPIKVVTAEYIQRRINIGHWEILGAEPVEEVEKEYSIISNQVLCHSCGDTPFSTHRHHMVSCKCGAISVDGGQTYLRRVGAVRDKTEMSIMIEGDLTEFMEGPLSTTIEESMDSGRNAYGVACAALRAIRDAGMVCTVEDGITYWSYEDNSEETPDDTEQHF